MKIDKETFVLFAKHAMVLKHLDSLDIVGIAMSMERETGEKIPDEWFKEMEA